jgi:hypothetical protein
MWVQHQHLIVHQYIAHKHVEFNIHHYVPHYYIPVKQMVHVRVVLVEMQFANVDVAGTIIVLIMTSAQMEVVQHVIPYVEHKHVVLILIQ